MAQSPIEKSHRYANQILDRTTQAMAQVFGQKTKAERAEARRMRLQRFQTMQERRDEHTAS